MSMKMENLSVKNAEYDLEAGFFWVVFENGKSIQCCLTERADGNGFKKVINFADPAIEWGINADVNAWAVTADDNYEFIYAVLKREARKAGVRIINP